MHLDKNYKFKIVLEYESGEVIEKLSTHPKRISVRNRDNARPAYIEIHENGCTTKAPTEVDLHIMVDHITFLMHTLSAGTTMRGRLVLKPLWFHKLIYKEIT